MIFNIHKIKTTTTVYESNYERLNLVQNLAASHALYILISLYLVSILFSCKGPYQSIQFRKSKKNIFVQQLEDSISDHYKSSCTCETYFDSVIRISKKLKGKYSIVQEYYSQSFYSVGKMNGDLKNDKWKFYCSDILIQEEFWLNGQLVWIKKYDKDGKLIQTITIGPLQENF